MEESQHSTFPWPGTALGRVLTCPGNITACLIHGTAKTSLGTLSSEKSPCLILVMIDCCKDTEMISAACQKKP